uniref:Uncharacterized protein n=1 Tax=Rhizophora mucronata TaxID=61149 RepID=A0A2P2MX15_RHIMU
MRNNNNKALLSNLIMLEYSFYIIPSYNELSLI